MGEIRTMAQLLDKLRHGYRVKKDEATTSEPLYAAHDSEKKERHFCVSLAGHTIEINSVYPDVYLLCEKYLSEGDPDIHININQDDIAFEREEATKDKGRQEDGYLETLAVYRRISEKLLDYDIFLMHGAVIAYDGNAYLFTAKSGTGKTTHIRKWLDNLEGAYVVNGDKPLIKITETEAVACGTPWCGKENMGQNSMIPLKAVIMMERGEDNSITEVPFSDAFVYLLQQTYQPNGTELMKKTLHLFSGLKGKVRFYKFIFNNMKDDVFSVAYNTLIKGEK